MGREGRARLQVTEDNGLEPTLGQIADFIEDGLLVIDKKRQVLFANLAMRQRMTKDDLEIKGKRCYQVFEDRDSPCHAPLWECPLTEAIMNGSPQTAIHLDYPPGADKTSQTYIKITMYPLRGNDGNIDAVAEVRRNIAAERNLEDHILRSHHHLNALNRISSAVSGLWELDAILKVSLDASLEIVSGVMGGILLFEEASQTLRYRVYRGLSAKYVEQMQMSLGEGIAGSVAQNGEPILLEDLSRDPRTAHPDLVSTEGLKGFASVPLKAKDKVVGVMNIASYAPGQFGTDDLYILDSIGCQVGTAIEQAKLYQRLARGRERYQALLKHALTAQEEERKRIARELHDETSQAITSLTLNLQALSSIAESSGITDAKLMGMFKKTQSLAIHAGNEIVRLMKELRPTLLDELGLEAAVNRYARDTLEPRGIKVEAKFECDRVPSEVEVTLFRIAQGVIGNILEHSEASRAYIDLKCRDKECVMIIRDNGKGFDVSKLTKVDPSGRGAGLFTMRERINLLGGTGSIKSEPGKGTEVVVRIPCEGGVAHD